MKKMRWTALLAALLMATTLMAGCQAEEKPGNTPVIEDDTPYNGELPLTKEPAKLRVMTHSGFAANMPEPNNDLLYYKETQKATGVEIEWDVVPNDSYTEVLQTKLAAGVDLPDIMNMYVGANVVNAYENGLFLPLDDLIEKYGYWTKKWFADGNEMYKDMWTMADGHIYSIQDYVLPTYNQVVPLYNTKWLEKLGKEVPTTLEEFEELVYAMKGVDFNGNGKNDEIILSGEINNYNTFGYTWGLEMHDGAYGFQTDDGKTVTCDYTDDRYREFLTFSNKLYQDGILDKELMSNTSTMMMEKIAADRIGIVFNFASFSPTYSKLTSYGVADPNAEIYTVGDPIKGPHGDQYYIERNVPGGDPLVITKECSNPTLAMKWIDYIFANPDNITLRYFGVEGTDYTVGTDGTKSVIKPSDGSSFNEHIYTYGGNQVPFAHQQMLDIKYATDPEFLVEANKRIQPFFKVGLIESSWTEEEQKTYTTYYPDMFSYVKEAEGLFISGQKPLDDSGWNEYKEALNALHLPEILAAYQSRYDRSK